MVRTAGSCYHSSCGQQRNHDLSMIGKYLFLVFFHHFYGNFCVLFQGPNSISDFYLPACTAPSSDLIVQDSLKRQTTKSVPPWQKIASGQEGFRVIFDMEKDIIGAENKNIPANMSRIIKYTDGKWTTAKQDGSFHLYNAFNNGDSGDVKKHKLSVFGLILSFNQNSGGLDLLPPDYEASKSFFPNISPLLVGKTLAKVVSEADVASKMPSKRTLTKEPCNVKWSNALRFDPTDKKGKCIHFTATTEGSLFLVFSTVPKNKNSWYYIEIAPERIAMYKVTKVT